MTTYTLHRTVEDKNIIIARGLNAVDAMHFIIEQDPTRHFEVYPEFYETFVRFDFALRHDGSLKNEGILLHATVPLTYDYEADKSAALEVIAVQFLRIAHDYWDGECDADESIDEGLQYAADREDALRMEGEIVEKFVDALTHDGYTVARDMLCNDFRLADPNERAEFVKHAVDSLIGEITVYRPGAAHRFSFNFGGEGWDIIRTANGRLEVLIETTIEPYRAKGHAAKADRRYPVDTSNSLSKFFG
jgi:hypothetical protein